MLTRRHRKRYTGEGSLIKPTTLSVEAGQPQTASASWWTTYCCTITRGPNLTQVTGALAPRSSSSMATELRSCRAAGQAPAQPLALRRTTWRSYLIRLPRPSSSWDSNQLSHSDTTYPHIGMCVNLDGGSARGLRSTRAYRAAGAVKWRAPSEQEVRGRRRDGSPARRSWRDRPGELRLRMCPL